MTIRLSRRKFVKSVAAGTCASGLLKFPKPRKPNVVLIVTDQQHGRALGCLDSFFETPALDTLSQSSIRFENHCCTTPQCSPSRSSIYTGYYPHQTGVIGNLGSIDHLGQPIEDLPTSFETLGSCLKDQDYSCAYFGKWHLGNIDHFQKHFDLADMDSNHLGKSLDQNTLQSSLEFLQDRVLEPDKPFLLCANFLNPHDIYEYGFFEKPEEIPVSPSAVPLPNSFQDDLRAKPSVQLQYMREDQGEYFFERPKQYWEHYRLVYREKCRIVDQQVGQILSQLETLQLLDNTVVIFTADHGDMDTAHRLVYKGPFMYEQMVHVPLMIRLPNGVRGSYRGLSSMIDLYPTICSLANARPPMVPGKSLFASSAEFCWRPPRGAVISEYFNKQQWVNPIRMLRTNQHKYVHYLQQDEELYDLCCDPDELNNLAGQYSYGAIKQNLRESLFRWMRKHNDQKYFTYHPTNRFGESV